MRLQSKSRATSNRLPWWKTADFHAVFAVSEKHTEYLPSWNFCSQRSLLQNLNSFSLSVVYYNTSNNISVEIDQTHDFFNETMMSHENSTPKDAELIGIVRRASERVSTVWFPHLFPWRFNLVGSGNTVLRVWLTKKISLISLGLWVKSRFLRGSRALKGNRSFRPIASLPTD